MAGSSGAGIVAVTVGNLPETTTMAREERDELMGMLNRVLKEFELEAEVRVEMGGDPPQGILRMAVEEEVDLIVMSTHGRSGLSEFTQGSVAREVVRDGRKPVLLVRPKGYKQQAGSDPAARVIMAPTPTASAGAPHVVISLVTAGRFNPLTNLTAGTSAKATVRRAPAAARA